MPAEDASPGGCQRGPPIAVGEPTEDWRSDERGGCYDSARSASRLARATGLSMPRSPSSFRHA